MKIRILNKKEVKEYVPEGNAVLVRVTSQLPFSKVKEDRYESIHKYGFEDIDYECIYSMTREESLCLIKNLLDNLEKEEIIVSCDYGQSRSPAIAIAYSIILFGKDKYNFKEKYPDYNRFVLDKILLKYDLISEKIGSLNKKEILEYINNQNLKGEINES